MEKKHFAHPTYNQNVSQDYCLQYAQGTASITSTASHASSTQNDPKKQKTKAQIFKQSIDQRIKKMKEVCKNVKIKKGISGVSNGTANSQQISQKQSLVPPQARNLQRRSDMNQNKKYQHEQQNPKYSLPIQISDPRPVSAKPIVSLKDITQKQSQSILEDNILQELNQSIVETHQIQILTTKPQIGSAAELKIIKFIDQGQYGKVYLAQSQLNKAIYSIKTLTKSRISPTQLQHIIRQTKIQSFLDHANIAKLYNFFIQDDTVYFVMQACMGGNLYHRLKKKRQLPQKQVQDIIRQVCSAVDYMHQFDIIHRDIKPQNILLHQNLVKVCDFGAAVHSPILRGTQVGTPAYAPPQMIKNVPYDSKVDIWCIGVLTYQLLFGNIPFQIRQQGDLAKIIEQEVFFSKAIDLSDSAKEFILACMAKNPIQRPTSRQLLKHQFFWKQENKYRASMAI